MDDTTLVPPVFESSLSKSFIWYTVALALLVSVVVWSLAVVLISSSEKNMAAGLPSRLYFRQLLAGEHVATTPKAQLDGILFHIARQMVNYMYVVGDAQTKQAVVVDACWDVDSVMRIAQKDGMTVTSAVATHYHFDHIGGALPKKMGVPIELNIPGFKELNENYELPLYLHASEHDAASKQTGAPTSAMRPLVDGERVAVSDAVSLKVLHTPGHSMGGCCLVVEVDGTPAVCISGDTVFPGSCGRLDLPESNRDSMFDSLSRLRRDLTPDSLPIYPGHAYGGKSSTVGAEKARGLLREMSKEQWRAMHG